ncbi:hypothetical protein E4U59_006345 [Claviceps monticola]|nr:hypothetical protein E4U59_006345 [Claviceps monticola]
MSGVNFAKFPDKKATETWVKWVLHKLHEQRRSARQLLSLWQEMAPEGAVRTLTTWTA